MIPLCLLNFMLFMQFMALATLNMSVLKQIMIYFCLYVKLSRVFSNNLFRIFQQQFSIERKAICTDLYINFPCSISGSLNFFLTIWQVFILKVNIRNLMSLIKLPKNDVVIVQ